MTVKRESWSYLRTLYAKKYTTGRLLPRIQDVIRVDTMTLGERGIFIYVDGDQDPFRTTGQYPVLAFLSDEVPPKPFYVARTTGIYPDYFTHVEDGASFVEYRRKETNASGNVEYTVARTSKFEVLALRHDPPDNQFRATTGNQTDRTGPLVWENENIHPQPSLP